MQGLLRTAQTNIKVKIRTFTIDNVSFKLHYVITTWMLMICTMLISSQELIGENIKCMMDKTNQGDFARVVNRFCYFSSTYTIARHMNATLLSQNEIIHPGVGAQGLFSKDAITHHAYYQWVPFVLFIQALTFYIPHKLWKSLEGGRMRLLIKNVADRRSKSQTELRTLQHFLWCELTAYNSWYWLIVCECLNLLNVLVNIFITDRFLGGQFMSLGAQVIREGLDSDVDPLDIVFPKMTKCVFYKYGPSGAIQNHDALCVMALNILNDKIYIVLWFWFLILLVTSALSLVWRLVSFLLFNRSVLFNKFVFAMTSIMSVRKYELMTIVKDLTYVQWLYFVYLSKNMKTDFGTFIKFMLDDMYSEDVLLHSKDLEGNLKEEATTESKESLAVRNVIHSTFLWRIFLFIFD